jgi:hypothetical protein
MPVLGKPSSWDLTSTASGITHEYASTNTADGANSNVISNTNNDEVISFFQNFTSPAPDAWELNIVLACLGTANCATFQTLNTAYTIVGGQQTCAPGDKCVSSDEQTFQAFFPTHYLTGGFLNVTDPPGGLAFNVNSVIPDGFTPYAGGTGQPVPEPSPLLLLALAGLIGGLGEIYKRKTMSR